MAEKVVNLGIKREEVYLYYSDKKGHESHAQMARNK